MIKILKVINIARVQLIMRKTSHMWIFVVFIQPLLYLFMIWMILKGSDRKIYTVDTIIGAGMMGTWSSILFSSGADIERERQWGTLEMLVGSPTSLSTIIMGKALTNSFSGIFSMILAYLTILSFNQQVIIKHPLLFCLTLIITLISVSAIGMIVCTLFTLSRAARGLINIMETPIFLLSGIMFPITILPFWSRPASYILSLTWGIEALKKTSGGINNWADYKMDLAILIVLTIFYIILSLWLFKIVENKAKKSATLGVF
ncbi:ABC transporter permease [Geosporobacter ferrireducens]|uniref:Transport permease protein n=1 Tax=Geosporobacter ferrireducens TaxID=1424294 RepID=A0A1D8GI19_9FIRM|nr:ABC transporter permease [Geosporobacter ferrireducens]AOT70571.1 hypothetical protein Gferi_13910 [Geosporobacter ferrireducens]